MSTIPKPLQAYVSGVGLTCWKCGEKVVDAIAPEDGEPYMCPSCANPLPMEDDELTRAALSDPAAFEEPLPPQPSFWRVVALVLVAVGALAMIFWKH